MTHRSINFRKEFGLFDEQWKPKVVAEMNDYQFKVVKLQGDFVWHDHKETDETFIHRDRRRSADRFSRRRGPRVDRGDVRRAPGRRAQALRGERRVDLTALATPVRLFRLRYPG
jgi:hypothetical protein